MPREDEVLLWTLALDAFEGALARLGDLLAPGERERARDLPPRRAREFVVTRATLRAVLAEQVGTAPEDLTLSVDERGKPMLEPPGELHFSISHTGGLGLVALARGRPVGVDVEAVRPRPRLERVAARVFSPAEQQRLGDLAGREQLEFFYATWTAREASFKVTGTSLRDDSESGELTVRRRAPAPGYLAAVAAPGTGWRLVPRELPSAIGQARSL